MSLESKLVPVLTEAGKQAVFNADTANLEVKITHIAVGSGQYEPTADRTSLADEKLRVEILSSSVDKINYQMTLNTIFKDEELEFYINEFGVFLEDGTLFAVWSSPTKTLAYKSIWSKPIFAFTLKIVDVNLDAVTIVDQGLDLKLNYLSEFTSFALSMQRFNHQVLHLFEKIKSLRVEMVEMVDRITRKIDESFNERDSLFVSRKKEVDSLLVANATAIIKIFKREVK